MAYKKVLKKSNAKAPVGKKSALNKAKGKRLSAEDRQAIISDEGTLASLSDKHGVSINTVMRVRKEGGIFSKRGRKPAVARPEAILSAAVSGASNVATTSGFNISVEGDDIVLRFPKKSLLSSLLN